MAVDTTKIKEYLLKLQGLISSGLVELDQSLTLVEDNWSNVDSTGRTRVLQDGKLFEKAGIGFSHAQGKSLPSVATVRRPELANRPFEVLGVSAIVHPLNPYVPTVHMNLRFFTTTKSPNKIWWFGGGFDLTPYYPFESDAKHWHNTAKSACKGFGKDTYRRYKKNCDDYFYIKHRQEQRGIGGLFFDDLNEWGFSRCFEFVQSVGEHFIKGYMPIAKRRQGLTWGERERDFQCYRRGRYVEFNLIYDRGTLFGLQSGGRIESILMSLPPKVHWQYDYKKTPASPEAELYELYLKPRDWAD